ncbi:interleukin-12 receptor subunit beta-1 isoform X2 [Etheostoma cragini]|uniref:interleukin-12 receptor subunit beta-1 isoform X2 n=1 Tax=Etheostoma cragini TaxID=417921 RepID=UPI00155E8293|nr:interleukin-12 receptor subunit beta-1 isoform X2 [Etheostoma cragini]
MSRQDFPQHLMETLKCWSSLYVFVFMFLAAVSKGSACEALSSPECFRRTANENVYLCEWSMNTTESDVTFDVYIGKEKFRNIKQTGSPFPEERLIKNRPVPIWVEARARNFNCTSPKRSVVLRDTVKYAAPRNISMSWLKNNLSLRWSAEEKHPALAEIQFRQHDHPAESWEKRTTNTTSDNFTYYAIVVNLLKDSAYKVQIRQRSTQARNPLWSDWSDVTVPAELEKKPEVTMTTTLLNGTRKVTLTWKPMPHAAAVSGVNYSLTDTQSSHGCHCQKNRYPIITNIHTTYVSLSAVNITVIAKNAAGYSPPAIVQVPVKLSADLKICDETLLNKTFNRKTCLELYELQDGDSMPKYVITSTGRKKKKGTGQIRRNLKDYVRYLYFEHRCNGVKPQTVKMCIFYEKEGVPRRAPQDLISFSETHNSVTLSWKAIPFVDQQGFLTHYVLCSVKISSQNMWKECFNISTLLVTYHLENLSPGAKYNISLVGVTQVGEGPEATVTINTLLERPVNVWWSLGLVFLFFFITTMCTCNSKRIKSKILPPVPTPFIPDFIPYQPESQCDLQQELLERKEEVHELTLHQLSPEGKSVPEDAEETDVFTGEWDDGVDEDMENKRGDSRMSGGSSDQSLDPSSTDEALRSSIEGEITDLEQVDNEIAMLIYRNGLVFDVKMDSP